jgi:hypothetical protein
MPLAAAWPANSPPIPEDPPVTSAHGPYTYLPGCFMSASFV